MNCIEFFEASKVCCGSKKEGIADGLLKVIKFIFLLYLQL